MKNKLSLLLNLIIILVISMTSAFYISTKIYDKYWQKMMTDISEILGNNRFNFIDEKGSISKIMNGNLAKIGGSSQNLNNQVWLLAKKNTTKSDSILDKIYFDENFIGTVVVFTNDGWFATNEDLKLYKSNDLVLINYKNEIVDIEKIVNDPYLGIYYIKVAKTGLEPVAIIDSVFLNVGENVYAIRPNLYSYQNEILENSIKNMYSRFIESKLDLVHKPTDIVIYGALNVDLDENLPIFNKDAQFVGFSLKNGEKTYLLPSKYIKYSLTNLFNNDNIINYPSLGVSYIDLSEVVTGSGENIGAYVYEVPKNSIFKKGDIITYIENDQINQVKSLNTILLDYKIGQEINVRFIRNGQEQKEKIVISDLAKLNSSK
ncbi:MAG: PDZ domain-containing protein [Patescibacteria group bacterium]|nr:PDZ domain-containing protein [Patescibacteria group bacterium]MDD4304693.1 PDZ domain-containing protein [Patescibacteria group bacterium]MDD4695339.1 PDZ domain-containing protein [Patescibacteria group bacterium]